jgi:hypothetical protein
MKVLNSLASFPARWIVSLTAVTLLASCSGGGCPACNVPAFNAPTLAPGATPTPPGFVPPPATPTPAPTPIAAALCSQGVASTSTATAVALGAAAPFALLGGAGVTNTGNMFTTFAAGATSTTLQNGFGNFNDDLIGAYPTTTVTGITGANDKDGATAIYATGFNSNNPFLIAAQAASTAASAAANAEAPTAPTFGGGVDLSQVPAGYSGHANCGPNGNLVCPLGTLGAGVYKSATTMNITAGPLTLDGGGNPNSVFIFQIGSALTMAAPGGNMILINGAAACNTSWADLAGATLGGVATGASFYGNILAPAGGISINTAITNFNGRAISGTASVSISAPVSGLTITNPGGN